MAKVVEEIVIIKLSKMVKDSAKDSGVINDEQRKLIEEAVPSLVEQVIDDPAVIVEIQELD